MMLSPLSSQEGLNQIRLQTVWVSTRSSWEPTSSTKREPKPGGVFIKKLASCEGTTEPLQIDLLGLPLPG